MADSVGPLSQLILSSSIRAANKDVAQVLSQNQEDSAKKYTSGQGKYQHCTSKEEQNRQMSSRIWLNACSSALFKVIANRPQLLVGCIDHCTCRT